MRSGDVVERLAEVDRVMLDKTGTLTEDEFAFLDIATRAAGGERARLLGWLSVIEAHCNHPVARPFARLPRPAGEQPHILSLRTIPGCGVEAEIERRTAAGTRFRSARREWIAAIAARFRTPARLPAS